MHVLLGQRDPAFDESGVASVRWLGANKVAGVLFAPGGEGPDRTRAQARPPAEAASFTMLKEQLETVLESLTPRGAGCLAAERVHGHAVVVSEEAA